MVCWAHPTATAPEVQGSPQRLWQGSVSFCLLHTLSRKLYL